MKKAASESKSPFATEPVGRLITKFAIPCVISLLVNSLYNIVDQIFIGWGVGYLGNGATNVVFPITIIALALSLMIGDGGAAYLSLKLGEGDTENARKGIGNAVTISRTPGNTLPAGPFPPPFHGAATAGTTPIICGSFNTRSLWILRKRDRA